MAKKLLLADDSVTIQKVVELAFLEEDFEVIAFTTGDEALAALEGSDAAILVCDVHMPGSDGYDVCQRAKAAREGLPVLLLVGTFEAFDDDRYESSGADGYLRKPFDSQELVRKVKQHVAVSPDPAEAVGVEPAVDVEEEGSTVQTFEAIGPTHGTAAVPPAESVLSAIEADVPDVALPVHETPGGVVSAGDEQEGPAIFDTLASEQMTAEPVDLAGPTEKLPTLDADSFGGSGPEAPPAPPPAAEVPTTAPSTERVAVDGGSEATAAAPTVPERPPAASSPGPGGPTAKGSLSDEDVERIARRVAELVGESVIREIAWEVVPDLAEVVVKERLDDLERQVEEL